MHSKALPPAHAVVGEDVIVNKPASPMHNIFGKIWKIRAEGKRLKISVSFDSEIYNFYCDELLLA